MKVTYYLGNYPAINKVPVSQGNVIFCENQKKIYFDGVNGRVGYDAIITFQTEVQRSGYANPWEGFYYVEETHAFWKYGPDGWTRLNPEPVITSPVQFMPYDDFPAFGQHGILYVDGASIYVWNDEDEDYELVSGSSDPEWIDV